ncbi:ATP phosphoribosyltransferase regulatory subunit [Methyloligella sp. 2.7D]|uniref:ATP phosphoribosyltransferase regulatory subunit n=1 Tax=unclassified Methyloligella TaxID=2625955 RepID=UPI00157CB109|nr:ATP phosphoribosyltransferase regulatory subunit [Methyloligella sp. GL2]QKP78368.1 ATP phosphoribosyltransferase regulatory subunit [Methyloligella sp. GL2]
MAAESVSNFEALEIQAAKLLDTFKTAGYEPVAPSILQPAGVFLDRIGEALRGRSYVFTDLSGEELCLRPDLTVPVSLLYLSRHPEADKEARYCYNGPAFRYQPGGASQTHPREFRQAGIESFGIADREAADIEMVLLASAAIRQTGLDDIQLRFGDIAMFFALLDALEIPDRWRRKLRHYFWRPEIFHRMLRRLSRGERPEAESNIADFARALDLDDFDTAQAQVDAYLKERELPLIGNRTLAEITSQLLDFAADLVADPLPKEIATVIEYYLAVSGTPEESIGRIAMIARGAGLDLDEALQRMVRRFERLEEEGIDLARARFAADFGRNLEYYTGLVFQIEIPTLGEGSPLAGGGRYDGLLKHLGAPQDVPAIGCAIHTERLLAVVQGLR